MRCLLLPALALLACGDDSTPSREVVADATADTTRDTNDATTLETDANRPETDATPPVDAVDTRPDGEVTAGNCTAVQLTTGLVYDTESTPDEGLVGFFSDADADLGFGTALADELWIEFFDTDESAISDTGTFDLTTDENSDYATCGQCVSVYGDIDGEDYGFDLFQAGGSITVDPATPPAGGTLTVTLTNVKLVTVTIDPDTLETTLVPSGPCYTLNGPLTLSTE